MKRIQIINDSAESAVLVLEPLGAEYALAPGDIVQVLTNDQRDLNLSADLAEVTLFPGRCFAVWVQADAIVMRGDVELAPIGSSPDEVAG